MRRLMVLVTLCCGLVLSSRAAAAADARPVQDHGDFFSPQAITAAEGIARDIKHDLGQDVLVITYPRVPKELEPELQAKGRDRFFADWLARIGDRQHVAIVVLITDHPGRVQVGVQKALLPHDFTSHDRDVLRDLLVDRFRDRQFDRGLIDAFRLIFDRMSEHHQPGAAHFADHPTTRPTSQPATEPSR